MYPKKRSQKRRKFPKNALIFPKRGWWYFSETLKVVILPHLTEFFWLSQKHSWKILLCCEASLNSVRAMPHILLNSLWPGVIKFRFYCSKIRDFKVYTKICAKLKTSKNFFFKVLLFCLLAILFCPLTNISFPLAPCKSILNTFVYEIYQRVSILFELSVKHTLSDFLLPFRCHEWRNFNSKKYR